MNLGDELTTVDFMVAACTSGAVSARELLTSWLERLHGVHERTNCVAAWNDTAALAAASALDDQLRRTGAVGPLHGLPITVKDWIDVAELPCSGGMIQSRDRISTRDATVVARLRQAGALIMAKTAVHTHSPVYGPVFHPIDPSRSPGGSSSGESAAVAGGGSPLGIGSDSGGSIRLPAAWCGAAGFKPTFGRVPTTGHFPRVGERSDGRTQIGPIGRNVADLVTVLSVIAGPDGHDAGVPPVDLAHPDDVDLGGLRIGWNGGEGSWVPSDALGAAVTHAVAVLGNFGAVAVGEIPQHIGRAFEITGRYWQRASLDGAEAERQLSDWDRYRTRALGMWREVDVLISPAAMSVAPPHREMDWADYIFTVPASLTGAPAAVVPFGESDGLPVAVQVTAAPWADHIALRVAAALEAHA